MNEIFDYLKFYDFINEFEKKRVFYGENKTHHEFWTNHELERPGMKILII